MKPVVSLLIFLASVFSAAHAAVPVNAADEAKLLLIKSCLIADGIPPTRIIARDSPNPEHSRYEDLNYQWNRLHGLMTPLAYLLASSTADVSSAVRCASSSKIRLVPRAGGHSFVKYGFGNSHTLVVDLQRLNRVKLVENSGFETGGTVALIGVGTRSGRIQYEVWRQSKGALVVPHGACPQVGLGGWAQGGGHGYFTRLHGMGSDNILEVRMVDWRGEILTVNNVTDPDLYWALRGGGGGNFGIVTRFTYKTYSAPKQIGLAKVEYDIKDFAAFFKTWQGFISPDPVRRVGTWPEFTGNDTFFMELWSFDGGVDEIEKILASSFKSPTPLKVEINSNYTLSEFLLKTAQIYTPPPKTMADLGVLAKYPNDSSVRTTSFYVDRVLTRKGDITRYAQLVQDFLTQAPTGVRTTLSFEPYGGVVNALRPSDTAFIHRGKILYNVHVDSSTEEGTGPQDQAGREFMRKFFENTKAVLHHSESYQNYLDEDLPDYLRRYYGANLERLVTVKAAVDPHNVFHNPQTIPTRLS